VIILDSALPSLVRVSEGLHEDGIVILNTHMEESEVRETFGLDSKLAMVDANTIAREILGLPITNTTMLGALLKATGIVGKEALEHVLDRRFGRLSEKNKDAMRRAIEETIITG
jgi:pyruvate ferredoxin oxidoreductase gamma subunit